MNQAILTGRLVEDPKVGEKATRFRLAVDRRKKEDGADFISCVAFGKTGEMVGKYLTKGSRVGVTGRITTGSYDKNGQKVYTTDIFVDSFEFLDSKKKESSNDGFEDYGLGFN